MEKKLEIDKLSAEIEETSKKMSEMTELVKHFSPERARALREILKKGGDSTGNIDDIKMLKMIEEGGQAGEPFAGYSIDPSTGRCDEVTNDIFLLVHVAAAEKAKSMIEELAEKLKKI